MELLDTYLELEWIKHEFEERGFDDVVECIMDAMDIIWRQFDEAEISFLNDRSAQFREFKEFRESND